MGMGTDVQVEDGDNDCELMFDGYSDDSLMEPPAESPEKS